MAERVKEQKLEIIALNEMLRNSRSKEAQTQEHLQKQIESGRVVAQERVDAANKAAKDAESSKRQLQDSVSVQIADAKKRCHQAEARNQAV